MHPVFARKAFATYLAVWVFFGVLLAGLLRMPETLSWRDALIISEPVCLFYAFVCLTPWYMCRMMPRRSSNWLKLLTNHLGAAILATALWIEMARFIAYLLDLTDRVRPEMPHLITVGLLLYTLSVALHYMLLAVEQS